MSSVRYSSLRIVLGIIFAIATFAYYQRSTPNTLKMTSRSNSNPVTGLEVTLKQASISPLTITTTVTNKNTHTVTFLQYNSPLDSLALHLGLFSITADGASEPLSLPQIQIRRMWPPKHDSLIQLEPGASQSSDTVLEEDIISRVESTASVILEGRWDMVWSEPKDSVTDADLVQVHPTSDMFAGDFASNILQINKA